MAMHDVGVLPDPDVRAERRDRSARRWVRATAWSASGAAWIAWCVGPCLAAIVWPYVWRGRPWVFGVAVVLGLAAAGLAVTGAGLRRSLASDPGAAPGQLIRVLMNAGAFALPMLMWCSLAAIDTLMRGAPSSFEWAALDVILLGSAPVVPFFLAAVAYGRYRRAFAALAPMTAGVVRPRELWRHGFAATFVLAMLWPGGPRAAGNDVIQNGLTMDEWAARWVAGDERPSHVFDFNPRDALPSLVAQWPWDDTSLRPRAARWLGARLRTAGSQARPFRHVQMDCREGEALVEALTELVGIADTVAPTLARWARDADHPARAEILYAMRELSGYGAAELVRLADEPPTRIGALECLADPHQPIDAPLSPALQASLEAWIDDEIVAVRAAALRAAAAWTGPERAHRLVGKILAATEDPERDVAGAAAAALHELPDQLAEVSAGLLHHGRLAVAEGNQVQAVALLRSVRHRASLDPELIELLRAAMQARNLTIACAGLDSAARFRAAADELAPDVQAALAHHRWPVRCAAFDAWVMLSLPVDELVAVLRAEFERSELHEPRPTLAYMRMIGSLDWLETGFETFLPTLQSHLERVQQSSPQQDLVAQMLADLIARIQAVRPSSYPRWRRARW